MASPLGILEVHVMEKVLLHATVTYYCQCEKDGQYRCGSCNRGKLGTSPRVGQACRVCKAKVTYSKAVPQ